MLSNHPPREAAAKRGDALAVVAIPTLGAAAIHLAVTPEHLAEGALVGSFFLIAGLVQALWAFLLLRGAPGRLLLAGAAGNLALVALWSVSRTSGLPFGPHPGIPEPVGRPDLGAVAFELLSAAVVLHTLMHRDRRHSPTPALIALGLATAIPLTVWALFPGSGHVHAGDPTHHTSFAGAHALHLTVLGAAPALFLALALVRIARAGLPSFSWRLAPAPTAATAPSRSAAPSAAPTPRPPALR
ncbi:MAG: hypothetical protein ACRDJ4_08920 [Actinomycetota bacterium]